jgi:hypothetical protein
MRRVVCRQRSDDRHARGARSSAAVMVSGSYRAASLRSNGRGECDADAYRQHLTASACHKKLILNGDHSSLEL